MTPRDQEEQFEFYWQTLLSNPSWQRASTLVASLEPPALKHLLRNHRIAPGTVSYLELKDRQNFDDALAFLSQIPIGMISGYYPLELAESVSDELILFLGNPSIVEYYEKNYQLLLPSLLRLHCTQQIQIPSESNELAWGAFQWFTGFALRLETNRDCPYFLNLLDGVVYGKFGLPEFKAILAKPEEAIAILNLPTDPPSDAQRCINGLLRFTSFCIELNSAFKMMESIPLTRSAMWFYFGYWFREQKNLSNDTVECVSLVAQWPAKLRNQSSATMAAAEETRLQSEAAVKDLASEMYAKALYAAIQSN